MRVLIRCSMSKLDAVQIAGSVLNEVIEAQSSDYYGLDGQNTFDKIEQRLNPNMGAGAYLARLLEARDVLGEIKSCE